MIFFLESDANKDRLISYDEFLTETKKDEFDEDPGWETMDMQVNIVLLFSSTLDQDKAQRPKIADNYMKFFTCRMEMTKKYFPMRNSEHIKPNVIEKSRECLTRGKFPQDTLTMAMSHLVPNNIRCPCLPIWAGYRVRSRANLLMYLIKDILNNQVHDI